MRTPQRPLLVLSPLCLRKFYRILIDALNLSILRHYLAGPGSVVLQMRSGTNCPSDETSCSPDCRRRTGPFRAESAVSPSRPILKEPVDEDPVGSSTFCTPGVISRAAHDAALGQRPRQAPESRTARQGHRRPAWRYSKPARRKLSQRPLPMMT